ncbi:ComEA family DNA-binding protein [Comamonas odontotermitis]|uniref:ComEA family DNA-binding protein n=1 Tax=Comamonas odontotermitis TaxID=379895 RepID=UPI00375216E0
MQWRWSLVGLALCTQLAWAQVEANVATEAQLDGIHGIGPATSGRILQARQSGPFTDWADLMLRVSGIGQKKAAQLSQRGLTVNGKSFAAPEPPLPPASRTAQ